MIGSFSHGDSMNVLRSKYSVFLGIFATYVAASLAQGQTSVVADQLDSKFKGEIFLLRGFYSGDQLEYDQNGVLRSTATQEPWTLAHVEITKLTLTPQSIVILGNRMGTLYKNGKPGFVKVGKVKIEVTRSNLDADKKETLDQVIGRIFIESEEDLRPLLPEYWQSYLAGNDLKSRSAAWRAKTDSNGYKSQVSVSKTSDRVSAPQPVYLKDPKYTKEAHAHRVEGITRLGTIIETTGTASNIAILEPLGMGLDEQAILALKQSKFQPAMNNGHPVRVQIEIEMDFR